MGGRGATMSKIGKPDFDRPLNEAKVGAIYKSLPNAFQQNIKNNLMMPAEMKEDIKNGRRNKMTDDWTTHIPGSKNKMKITTDVDANGTVFYTAKIKNKIIHRSQYKEQIANTIAKFYNDELKKIKSRY